MALQVWLPLNGDLRNLGLDDITFTQTTVAGYEVGKIGQALSLLGTNIAFTAPSLEGLTKFSVAFWFKSKTNSSITTKWNNVIAINSSNADESTTSEWRFESSYGSSRSYILSAHNNVGEPIMTGTLSLVSERDKWYHVVATCDGESFIKFYINGEHINSDRHYLGGHLRSLVKIANEPADPDALLNDLRIYDHTLSQKEIKLLSQGLVAHYPLNDGVGGANIAWNSSLTDNLTSWVKSGTWDFVTKDGFPCCHNTGAFKTTSLIYPKQTFNTTTNGMLPYNGLIITMSADVLLENVVKGTTNYFLALYKSGETIDGSWKAPTILANSGHFTSAASETLEPSKLNGKGWTHVWVTFKWGDYAWSNTNYRLQFYARDYTGDVYVKNLKIELGEKPTSWIPNPADALYSKMGLDNGVVYDCSGYGHDGSVVGECTTDTDSPRYSCSKHITSDNPNSSSTNSESISYIVAPVALTTPECMSIAWWGYHNPSYNGGKHGVLATSSLDVPSDYLATAFNHRDSGYDVNASDSTHIWLSDSIVFGGWHHYVITYDGQTSKTYTDGVQINSAAFDAKKALHSFNKIFFGYSKAGGVNRRNTGNYSDIRIYATALSAEDVKNLYETAASIDDHGNVYGYELEEV